MGWLLIIFSPNRGVEVLATVEYYGTGKRKSSTARVRLLAGSGHISVNKQDFNEYFCNETQRTIVRYPLTITDNIGKFDIRATVRGGGTSGQAGALRLGIAKALLEFNAELRPKLKRAGLLTRDSRIKERKKYGQKGARKRFQFSKR
jgi:small subunit ribosomal protein S9